MYQNIEEASVELLAKEISLKNGYEVIESGYDENVNRLIEFNKELGLYDNTIDFAKELFNVPMNKRLDCLEEKIYNVSDITIEKMEDLNNLLDDLY